MSEDTQSLHRVAHFRGGIAGFIETRREAKLKGKEGDAEVASKYEYATWLADAAKRVGQIQAVTHVLKATHPDARGASLHVEPTTLPARAEIGSHVLGKDYAEDVVGNAAALDVFKFLKVEVVGRRLIDWMHDGDTDLRAALSDDPQLAESWMAAFRSLVREDVQPATHTMAKQVYWLVGEEPQDDTQYHLLQPMFSSSLAHVVHTEIQDARFGEENKEARQAFRERKPSAVQYRDYRGLVARKLGGTKPQNISQLNSERGGVNYLLASLPPPAWQRDGRINMLKRESAFEGFLWFGGVRELLRSLTQFLRENPDPTMETRQRREIIEQAIGDELAMYGVVIRTSYSAGWTRDEECRLPRCEQLWLDPDRVTLAVRADSTHPEWTTDDESFNAEYDFGNWADEVAGRLGNWLNARLREAGLVTVAKAEQRHWAQQAVIDVAWPLPMQRRAQGGVA